MSPEELEAVCNQLAEGKSLRSICREIGQNECNVRYWLAKDEKASAHAARAREMGCDALADECLEIADGSEPSDVKRVRIDTRIRLIGKWSQRYGDKTAHEHSGPNGGPIETSSNLKVEGLTDEQLRALASIPVQSE